MGYLLKGFLTLLPICFLSSVVSAQTQGNLELKIVAQKEVVVTDSQGKKQIKRVEPAKVVPGDEIIYTISYTNIGSEDAENVNITNPVPEHMAYKEGSAAGIGTAITFSVDKGITYDVPVNLKIKNSDGTVRPVVAEDFTNIRWTLSKPLQPKGTGYVEYRAILK